ncbi:MAG: hypothetical protein IJ849_08155 [Selenomonadaceae bacterium]|nr:hypothetical protein [Selenomonadaceae bacterium]
MEEPKKAEPLDRYETAKLVELFSHPYRHAELKSLSDKLIAYGEQQGCDEPAECRCVYYLNSRRRYLKRLITPQEREMAGTLPLEREVAFLYVNRPTDFQELLAEANKRIELQGELFSDGKVADTATTSESLPNDYVTRCQQILAAYPQGLSLASPLDIDRFWLQYEETFGSLPGHDDAERLAILQGAGESREGKLFSTLVQPDKNLLTAIKDEALAKLRVGYSCVYFSQLLKRHREDLGKAEIYSAETLADLISPAPEDDYASNGERITSCDREANIGEDMRRFLRERGSEPTPLDAITREMWQLPPDLIEKALRSCDDIICTDTKIYMTAEAFPLSRDDLPQIRQLLKKELVLTPDGKILDETYRPLLEKAFPTLATDTATYSLRAFHGALGYFLKDNFRFEKHYLIRNDVDIASQKELFAEFCAERESFTLEELRAFAAEHNANYRGYYDLIRQKALRVSQENFVNPEKVSFDIAATDEKLAVFCSGEYLPLKEIQTFHFLMLPSVDGAEWSKFLLESYLYGISRKFHLLHVGFTDGDTAGVMARRDAPFNNYGEILADALSQSRDWKNESEALEFLAGKGYLSRANYGKIKAVCRQARYWQEHPREEEASAGQEDEPPADDYGLAEESEDDRPVNYEELADLLERDVGKSCASIGGSWIKEQTTPL